jgi:hypothetical protein
MIGPIACSTGKNAKYAKDGGKISKPKFGAIAKTRKWFKIRGVRDFGENEQNRVNPTIGYIFRFFLRQQGEAAGNGEFGNGEWGMVLRLISL